MAKKIHNYNSSGYYINSVNARIDPLESEKSNKNIYLLPANATFIQPPESSENKIIRWDGSKWIEEEKEVEAQSTDLELLEVAKNDKLNEILIKRKSYQYANINYNDRYYLNTVTSQNKFFNLINNTTSDIEWRLADGSWIILNREQMAEISNLIIQRESKSYKEETRLINLINEAQDIEVVKNINWELQ